MGDNGLHLYTTCSLFSPYIWPFFVLFFAFLAGDPAVLCGTMFFLLFRCQDILALTGADAAEGLDPTPTGRGGMKRFRAGTSAYASRVRGFNKSGLRTVNDLRST